MTDEKDPVLYVVIVSGVSMVIGGLFGLPAVLVGVTMAGLGVLILHRLSRR